MSKYILFVIAVIFCFIGFKILTYKTGNHDIDFFLKIIGFVILVPFLLLALSALGIIGWTMKVHIEYCIKWNYGPEFDRVSNLIGSLVPNAVIVGNETEPRSGSFEVEVEGKIVFSKFSNERFPDKSDVLTWF